MFRLPELSEVEATSNPLHETAGNEEIGEKKYGADEIEDEDTESFDQKGM